MCVTSDSTHNLSRRPSLQRSKRKSANFGFGELEVPDVQQLKDEILVVLQTSLHPVVFATAALSVAITALILYVVESNSIWLGYLSSAKPAISILGAFLGFSLAFRINICCECLMYSLVE